jgi:hypothetical protein
LLPAIQAAREAARRSDCMKRIRQLVLAAHNFESAQKKLPPHGDVYLNAAGKVAGALIKENSSGKYEGGRSARRAASRSFKA